jgi:hypothetical protein
MGKKKIMKYVWIILTVMSAFGLGKRVFLWGLAAYFFSWAALIAVIVIPANQKKLDERKKIVDEWSENTLAQIELNKVDTVDDLFKQLEKPKG